MEIKQLEIDKTAASKCFDSYLSTSVSSFTSMRSRHVTKSNGIVEPKSSFRKFPSVSPRMNTTASRDQFKPIRIGENLVVNYRAIYTGENKTRTARINDTK